LLSETKSFKLKNRFTAYMKFTKQTTDFSTKHWI